MQNRFKILFRQKQLFLNQDPLQPVVVVCNFDGTASYVPGTVPNPNWVDVTADTEGLEKLKMIWRGSSGDITESDSSDTNEMGSNYEKGVTANLTFGNNAYKFIYDWLMTETCQLLNCVEAQIIDMECRKSYRIFEIKLDNLKYGKELPCIVSVPLREQDEAIHVFQKTIIEDNWQNWFNREGTSTKDHPTFQIIVEKKPKFFLAVFAALIYVVGMLSVGILIALTEGKRWIRRSLGFTYFCPSPLIRTYIENICAKYGFTFDTIFDDDPANPYRDVCLFWPASTSLKNFDNFDAPSTKFIWDNRSVLPFSKFLDQLKKVFNAEWYVTPNNELVFKPKAFFDGRPPLYDFTLPSADELYFLEYTFNGKKKPAYGEYSYLTDPQDTCSNELKYRYNAIVDYDGPANNPMLEGKVEKSFDFAMTSFHNDGSSEDFLEEGIELGRIIAIAALIVGLGQLFLAANPITVAAVAALLALGYNITNNYVNDFFDNDNLNGMVRVSNSEVNIPRLLLWDRTSPMNRAKVVSVTNPVANPYYNPTAISYYDEHPSYDNANVFGTDVTKVYNYPLYVDEMYVANLFDRFHEYDNPLRNLRINQDWEGEVDLCCEWLDRLGVWQDDFAKIGDTVILEKRGTRLISGRIDEFEIDYDKGIIKLKGTVLK